MSNLQTYHFKLDFQKVEIMYMFSALHSQYHAC